MHVSQFLKTEQEMVFHPFISRKGGKPRKVAEPSAALYELQTDFRKYLERFGVALPSAKGSVVGESPLTNVRVHRGMRYFYILDFKGAFPSVQAPALAKILFSHYCELGSLEEIQDFLERYFFLPERGLAQGGPASPLLFNMYCEELVDQRIRALLEERERQGKSRLRFTRYIDDLTLSSADRIPKELRRKIREIVTEAGFQINHTKTRPLDNTRDPVEITGIRLLSSGELTVTDGFKNRLECALNAYLYNPIKPDLNKLRGLIGFYQQVRLRSRTNRLMRGLDSKIEEFHFLEGASIPRKSREERLRRLIPKPFLDEIR